MQPEPAIVPRPTSIAFSDGEFLLTPKTKIDVADRNRELGEQLRAFLRPATGLPLEIVAEPVDDAIEIRLDETLSRLGPEGYRLNIEPKQVRIEAYRTAGAFFGIQTLRQLLPPQIYRKARVEGIPWAVPCLRIEDRPRFAWRGALIDSCRHILPKEGILRFLDTLSAHKLNTFHWHLTDDNGWRLEIRKYPKLTEIGAWQPEWLEEYDPPKPKSGTRGGFYSQEDVREIVAYAAALQIDIVPEIEMPGHSGAIVASYPETGVPGSNVLNTEDSTVRFLQDVLDEVMELFPSQFIHVGGDEVDKGPWKNDPRTQELLRQRGLKDENELQSWFIRQMDAYLDSKGRRLVGWDEILEGGLAPGATVMSWRGMQGGIDSAKAGHDVVMTPSSHTYFDYYQADPEKEPLAFGGFLPLEKVYSFEPVPPSLSPDEARHILGVQGQLWTENIPNIRHLEYMAWPRLAALSEVGWSEARDPEEFRRKLPTVFARLDAMGVNYRPAGFESYTPLGEWGQAQIAAEGSVLEWDATPGLASSGEHRVRIAWTHGGHGLHIAWVELLEDGRVVDRDEHEGYAGWNSKDVTYRLNVPNLREGARYTLRASVRAEGERDAFGEVYVWQEGSDRK